jgi:hypothetical protein
MKKMYNIEKALDSAASGSLSADNGVMPGRA